MTTISDLYENLKAVKLRQELPKIVQQTSFEIEYLNKRQLNEGKTSEGVKIKTRYKSPAYARKKNQMNALPGLGVPDLKLTGSFYNGMGVVIKGKSYEIDSKDAKSARLEKKYGKVIFGLTDENKSEYAQGALYTGIKSYIEGKTGLKFR